jgi:hypothetical protein
MRVSCDVNFDAHYFSRRTNHSGHQYGYVSHAGAKIENALAWTKACFAEKSHGDGSNARGLPNQTVGLRIRLA